MAEGTKQYQYGQQQMQPIPPPQYVANPYDNETQQDPLLIIDSQKQITNHNDTELFYQQTVINLNNKNVRLTIWSIIYMILATTSYQVATTAYLFYDDTTTTFWGDTTENDISTYWSLYLTASLLFWWAAAFFLCTLYCICCKCNCNGPSACLFFVGAILQSAAIGEGISVVCEDLYYAEDAEYCRIYYVGLGIFTLSFAMYLTLDIVNSIGNNIRTRVFVKSLFAAVQSFLFFAFKNRRLQQILDYNSNDWWDWDFRSEEYFYRALSGGYMMVALCCCIVLLLIICGKGRVNDKLNPYLAKILGFFLIMGVGGSMMFAWFATYTQLHEGGLATHYLAGIVLLIYDIQYL